MFNIILPGSLSIVIYQDHYEGQYRKKNNCPYNDAMEILTPKSRMMLFDPRWVRTSKEGIM
jgi:hypothetical protein